jgi:hypothetical protein
VLKRRRGDVRTWRMRVRGPFMMEGSRIEYRVYCAPNPKPSTLSEIE